MFEQLPNEVHPAPGQLWRNVRTGDVLFIYRKCGQIEGVLGDGRKKSDREVMSIGNCRDGWRCIYSRTTANDPGTDIDSYEFRAK